MNFFEDRKIKKIARDEDIKAPDKYLKSVERTLNDLKNNEEKIKPIWSNIRKFNYAIAMAMLMFVLLTNVSPKFAYAMQELPIIGDIVKVITIRNYFDKDGNSEIEMEIPNIKNDNNYGISFGNKDLVLFDNDNKYYSFFGYEKSNYENKGNTRNEFCGGIEEYDNSNYFTPTEIEVFDIKSNIGKPPRTVAPGVVFYNSIVCPLYCSNIPLCPAFIHWLILVLSSSINMPVLVLI